MTGELRELVRTRAAQRCEYCGLNQEQLPFALFHIEHIRPRQHGGKTELGNLALSCQHCNLHKGPNLSGIDPVTDTIEKLFNPRADHWPDHFQSEGGRIIGLTPQGRATVETLAMNAKARIRLRLSLRS
ncbi:MAG: HNH endonuclease [Verrucomicrobiae bacterium]|nr:HNH endonuclease [Verrucomicrobiae bacterium]MCP5540757.1 HNH endonuclease [Akkermansiaceae bacterium]MCP5551339.1 HNH endonuclease [Akkermansiaceae bacterium]